MAEFLHEVVRRRERSTRSSVPSYLTRAYDDLMTQMEESYRRMSVDMRAQEAIDSYMSRQTGNIPVGMRLQMPVLDINAQADAQLASHYITYMFTGESTAGYRGWVSAP